MNNTTLKSIMTRCNLCNECKEKLNDEIDKIEENEEDNKRFNKSSTDEWKTIKMKDLGIYSKKSIIPALVRDNVINSNLVSDIKKIEYTKLYKKQLLANEKYKLKRLEDLPSFIDDIYGWGYFTKDQADKTGNRFSLDTKSNNGIANVIIEEITTCIKKVFKNLYEKFGTVKIVFTASLDSNGKIEKTIKEQEERTDRKILRKFLDLNKLDGSAIAGYLKFKVDTSDLTVEEFQKHVRNLDYEFYNHGFGFYAIDCTRDYSRTLNRALFLQELEYQGFVKEEDLYNEASDIVGKTKDKKQKINEYVEENIKKRNLKVIVSEEATIKASGTNIVKYYYFIKDRKIEVKFYNKLVSNYESRGVQDVGGTHLSEHVYNNKEVLMKTFYHPDVLKEGVTREITINGFNEDEEINYMGLLEEEYKRIGTKPIFLNVPIVKQWKTLEKAINKNCVFQNRATGEISIIWFGSSLTGKFGGVGGNVVKSMKNLNEDLKTVVTYVEKEKIHKQALKEWNNGLLSVISNFGFQNVPIYVIDLDVIKDDIIFFKPRLFMKKGPTILTPYTYPNTLYSEEIRNKYDPLFMMPESEKVKWMWRTPELNSKKCLGRKKIYKDIFKVIEVNDESIIKQVDISTLSKKKRSVYENQLNNNKIKTELKVKIKEELDNEVEKALNNEENERLLKEIQKKEKRAKRIKTTIGDIFKNKIDQPKKIRELKRMGLFYLFGFKECDDFIRLSYFKKEDEKHTDICFCYGEIIQQLKDLKNIIFKEVEAEYIKYKKKEPVFFMPYKVLKVDCSNPLNLKIINVEEVLRDLEKDKNFNNIQKLETEENDKPNYETLKELKHIKKDVIDVDNLKENETFQVLGYSKSNTNNTQAYFHLFVKDKEKMFFIKGCYIQNEVLDLILRNGDLNNVMASFVVIIGPKKYHPIKKRKHATISFIFPEIKKVEEENARASVSSLPSIVEGLEWDDDYDYLNENDMDDDKINDDIKDALNNLDNMLKI